MHLPDREAATRSSPPDRSWRARAHVTLVDSLSPDYRSIERFSKRRTPTGLLDEFPEPSADRYAAILGPAERPLSVAIISGYHDLLDRCAPHALGLYLVDGSGRPYRGSLSQLSYADPFFHLELIESFDRARGFARRIVSALADAADLIASPLEESLTDAYLKLGFQPLEIYDGVPERPLMHRARNR